MTVTLRVRRLPGADPSVPLPCYQTAGAAGLDLPANLSQADRGGLTLRPGERRLIPTGLAVDLPEGWEIQLRPRSGLALRDGVTLLNTPGTIDSDYRGEIGVLLINHGTEPFTVTHGMRIAQMVVAPVVRAEIVEVEDIGTSERGAGGFGSTGRG